MSKTWRCCVVTSAFGLTLHQSVVLVGAAGILISALACITSIYKVSQMVRYSDEYKMYSNPDRAAQFLSGLVGTSLSVYQIIISACMLWEVLMNAESHYLCSVWFISHLSILSTYAVLLIAKASAFFYTSKIAAGLNTAVTAVIYEGVFIYFCIIVNSYINTVHQSRRNSINVYLNA